MFRSLIRGLKPVGPRPFYSAYYSTIGGGGRLNGKVALVTGGAMGLGKAMAREFIKNGARVIIADINSQMGLEAVNSLGQSAYLVVCDVADEAQVASAVDTAVARYGRLDIMVNNAGIPGPLVASGIPNLDMDQFDRVIRVNLSGTMSGIKHAARVMVPSGTGSIICMSSISAILGGVAPHPYTASKTAVLGLVKSAASELRRDGIRINCISSGPTTTPLAVEHFRRYYPSASCEQVIQIIEGLSAGELKGTLCEEIDVAQAALYLASDESKFVTGHNLVVDGGFTCIKTLNFPSPESIVANN